MEQLEWLSGCHRMSKDQSSTNWDQEKKTMPPSGNHFGLMKWKQCVCVQTKQVNGLTVTMGIFEGDKI